MAPSVQRRKVWLTPSTRVPCSNAAKTRNPLKLANRSQPLVGWSSPYCEDMRGRHCCLTSFFPIVDTCLSSEDIVRQRLVRWCPDDHFCDFLGPTFSASHAQHISDMHSKFALEPHHMWKYMADIQSPTAEIRWGKKEEGRKTEITGQKYRPNGLPYSIGRP